MADTTATFSESWYRVANQKIYLRPSIKVRKENFRGQRWVVLENPFSNQFFRLHPSAYDFVARLRPDRTVEETWKECLEKHPDGAPGQEAVIQLLTQLYHANLLQYNLAEDAAQLFKRFERVRQREQRSRWMNIMFMRFPLLDPDQFLVKTLPFIGKLISPLGALIWFVVVGWACKVAIDNAPSLWQNTQAVLSPSNLPLLYLGLILIKTLHEFGHAYFCRRFGGEVHIMGVMLLIFTPVPYMDATSSWGFRNRWHRILVGGAGMIVEVFVAALATFVWANTGQGAVHSLAYNMMFVASVSTLIFNINPLLRYDGYYMLSDWLQIPNLHQRATQQLKYLSERYLFGVRKVHSPAQTKKEAGWLTIFGASSSVYRVIVFGAILLFVADRFLILGLIMAAVCLISWITVPLVKLVMYLASSPRLERNRGRAIAVTAGGLLILLAFLQFVPLPSHFRAPGVVRAQEWSQVYNDAPGIVEKILVKPGTAVTKGQALIELRNPEIDLELSQAQASYDEIQSRLRHAMQEQVANLKPLNKRLEAINLRLALLKKDKDSLVIRARQDGVWVLPRQEDYSGRWLARGSELGLIVNPAGFEFVATVAQEDGGELFTQKISGAQVRLFGESGAIVQVANIQVLPAEKRDLPSAALGWAAGGEMAVSAKDPEGRRTVEPFFEVHAAVASKEAAALLHGRAGKIRFDLGSEPLLPRWVRRVRQLLQKRYQL